MMANHDCSIVSPPASAAALMSSHLASELEEKKEEWLLHRWNRTGANQTRVWSLFLPLSRLMHAVINACTKSYFLETSPYRAFLGLEAPGMLQYLVHHGTRMLVHSPPKATLLLRIHALSAADWLWLTVCNQKPATHIHCQVIQCSTYMTVYAEICTA